MRRLKASAPPADTTPTSPTSTITNRLVQQSPPDSPPPTGRTTFPPTAVLGVGVVEPGSCVGPGLGVGEGVPSVFTIVQLAVKLTITAVQLPVEMYPAGTGDSMPVQVAPAW